MSYAEQIRVRYTEQSVCLVNEDHDVSEVLV